jgi:hypothetical protein
VIQVADTARGVSVYDDIFSNSYYGPEINMCKRFWSEQASGVDDDGTGDSNGSSAGHGAPLAAVIGGPLAGVAVVAVIVVVVIWRRRPRKDNEDDHQDITTAPLSV